MRESNCCGGCLLTEVGHGKKMVDIHWLRCSHWDTARRMDNEKTTTYIVIKYIYSTTISDNTYCSKYLAIQLSTYRIGHHSCGLIKSRFNNCYVQQRLAETNSIGCWKTLWTTPLSTEVDIGPTTCTYSARCLEQNNSKYVNALRCGQTGNC